ncbi:MAG TPA: 2,3-bisphosphoglycerate-independent phosphoglycerate mutase [Anaerolineales bacterium]|nr:2,3-bisphosphoglycerate-independent phosphoglycerate mutase [Anaerolineales bacterium]
MPFDYILPLLKASKTKIVLIVMDGLGGLPIEPGGPTELEAARKPNMDRLAAEGMLGQTIPIRPGITPGSGPAHLALFGYDPIQYEIGRGVLESVGVGLHVGPGDVAARGNFATLDASGDISDRRAGRIPTEAALPVVERLKSISLPGVETEVRHVKEYRFAVVLRGKDLSPEIDDTDPQQTGVPPLPAQARAPQAQRTAELFNQWIAKACQVLADQPKANGLTLRGFATDPNLPSFEAAYGLRPACISVYPMYKGVAALVGMQVIDFIGESPDDEFAALERVWNDFDFFFIHIKKTDSKGEDGDFAGKARIIEGVDAALPRLLALKPDVLIITGDHSTPSRLRTHSWHPVPFLLWAPATVRPDDQARFGERACAHGGLGTFPAVDTMPLALAHAGRLEKFGA